MLISRVACKHIPTKTVKRLHTSQATCVENSWVVVSKFVKNLTFVHHHRQTGCYIWYSKEALGKRAFRPFLFLGAPNITTHPVQSRRSMHWGKCPLGRRWANGGKVLTPQRVEKFMNRAAADKYQNGIRSTVSYARLLSSSNCRESSETAIRCGHSDDM